MIEVRVLDWHHSILNSKCPLCQKEISRGSNSQYYYKTCLGCKVVCNAWADCDFFVGKVIDSYTYLFIRNDTKNYLTNISQLSANYCLVDFQNPSGSKSRKLEVKQVHRFEFCQNPPTPYNELNGTLLECQGSAEEAQAISLICQPDLLAGKVVFPINELLRIFPKLK